MSLSRKEINARMLELRNLRKLHTNARTRLTSVEAENKDLKVRIHALEEENASLKRELSDITFQLSELQTIVFRKKRAVPPEDDEPPAPPVPRTKESYQRPIPKDSEVTKTVYHRFKRKSIKVRTKTFYVEDIPLDIQKTVTKHVVEQEWDGSRWIGAVPIPPTPVILGDNVRMLVATLVTIERLSHADVQNLLALLFHIHISDGEIVAMLNGEAARLTGTYESLKESIRTEPFHHLDESTWRVRGQSGYVWNMTGASGKTVYTLGQSRGKGVAEDLRGESPGVLISDDYGAYRNLAANHQLCFAHLIRKFRDLAAHQEFSEEDKERCSRHYAELKHIFNDLKVVLQTGTPLLAQEQLTARFEQLAAPAPSDPKPLARIKATLLKNIPEYLTCLSFPEIPLTNNAAERALRHVVLKRKVSFGSWSSEGARTLSILLSVLLTLYRRDKGDYFGEYGRMRG